MNKKLFFGVAAAAMMFAGCSSSADQKTAGTEETATVETDKGEVSATLTKEDGKVTAVSIDEIQDGESKKDLGDDYGMKKASPIGKEWFEQIDYLENYIVENGVDAVKLDSDGYAENEDLKSGCTINLTNIMKAVDEANAK